MIIKIMNDEEEILETLNINEPSGQTTENCASEVKDVLGDYFDVGLDP